MAVLCLIPLGFAALAAVIASTRGLASRRAHQVAGLLVLSGADLTLWAWWSLGTLHPSHLTVPLPWPFPTEYLSLSGLRAGAALLAGLLFIGAGLIRACRVPSRPGPVLLLHLLLLSVLWFLACSTPVGLLAGWEAVSITSYLLLLRDRPRVRRAAWALLALTEVGSGLLLFALVVWSGTHPLAPTSSWPLALALIALFAFGAKAGLFPLQIWVPLAEPEATGDVAGLFSGLLTALAMVGYLRVVHWTAPHLFPLGIVTAVFGLAGATGGALLGLLDRDPKRVLAYGTIEAVGLAFTALGIGMLLQARGAGSAAEMAIAATVILLLSHGGAKFTLFTLAGWIEDRTGLRRLDRMGGLFGQMRGASGPLLLASVTLAGLPPFGSFLGEWLLLEACLVPTPSHPALHIFLAVVAAITAIVTALGMTLYLRWIGFGWLGRPHSPAAAAADPRVPTVGLVGLWIGTLVGIGGGIAAGWIIPWTSRVTDWLAAGQPVVAATYRTPAAYAPIVALGAALFRGIAGGSGNVIFAAGGFNVSSPWDLAVFALLLGTAVFLFTRRRRPTRLVRPWAGGEPLDDPRWSWTSEALPHPLRLAFARVLGLERVRAAHVDPSGIRYRTKVLVRLEHHVYRPLLRLAHRTSGTVRNAVQSGDVTHYVGYLVAFLVVGMAAVLLLH